jgi:glycosyltransferase involved in cell wall biosynthesis
MQVAHISVTFPPYRGGTGNVCYHNAVELARRGHMVQVFTVAVPPGVQDWHGVQVHRLTPLFRLGNAAILPDLRRGLSRQDLVHLHYPFIGGELAVLAARRLRIPLVITYHQDVILPGVRGVIEKGWRISAGRWVLRSARRVLFTSDDYRQASHASPMLKGLEARIGVLPNGVDPDHFCPGAVSQELERKFKPDPEQQIILLVAGLDRAHYFKGIPVLLKALVQMPRQVGAVIVGDGDMRASYQAEAAQLGLQQRVAFVGRVSDQELPDYYRLADVTVLPSTTMGEAFGMVLLESMACGTPVVASNLPGVRTVVTDGVDGALVQSGDDGDLSEKLQVLLDAPAEQRKAMGRAGRAKVMSSYSWKTIADQLEVVYSQVLLEADGGRRG